MFSDFKSVTSVSKFKVDNRKVVTDDVFFVMHYRATVVLLVLCVLLVTQRQYIGEHIKCVSDAGVIEPVINTYCFFSGTFTVVKHLNETALDAGHIAHPGVGPTTDEDETIHHAYYQWVPFILFIQALTFYIPRALWKSREGGKLNMLVFGFRAAFIPGCKKSEDLIMSEDDISSKIRDLKREFERRTVEWTSWSMWLLFCEFLNLLNLILQFWLTHIFLGGLFFGIGNDVWTNPDWNDNLDPLDIIFPKVTKCVYYKYGPGGGIQNHDALCVMALNVIHEKIYTILWFWYVILFIFTCLGLINRILMMILSSRSTSYNKYIFMYACPRRYSENTVKFFKEQKFGPWLFLYFLSKNMTSYASERFFESLVPENGSPAKEAEEEPLVKNAEDAA